MGYSKKQSSERESLITYEVDPKEETFSLCLPHLHVISDTYKLLL